MQEFYIAHQRMTEGNVNFLIPIILEDLNIDELSRDLQTYLRTYTYIDARKYDVNTLRKKIRFSMPDVPLQTLIKRKNDEQQHLANHGAEVEAIEDDNERILRLLQGDGTILDVPFPVRLESSSDEESESVTDEGEMDIFV